MELPLELDIAVVMEADANHAQRDERQHQALQNADAGDARRHRMPNQNGYAGAQKRQWNPLRRLVDVAEQDELTDCAQHADRECTEKQSSNCSERLRLSRGPMNHEQNGTAVHTTAKTRAARSLRASLSFDWNGRSPACPREVRCGRSTGRHRWASASRGGCLRARCRCSRSQTERRSRRV